MDAVATTRHRAAKVIGLVSSGHFFSHFYWLVLPPLFPLLLVEFDITYTALGLLVSAMSIASGVAQLPMGFLVDRFNPVVILVLGLAIESAAILFIGLSDSYWMVLALVILAGLGNSVFHPADYSILSATVQEGRLGRAFSVHTFAGHAGWAVAPVLMGTFAAVIGWRIGVIAVGLAGLGVALLIFINSGLLNDRTKSEQASLGARDEPTLRRGLQLLLTPAILACFLFFLLIATALTGFTTFLVSAFVKHHGTTLSAANFALTMLFSGSAVGILVGGVIADHTRRHGLVIALGLGVTAALVIFLGELAFPITALIALVTLTGFASGLVAPSRDLIVRASTPVGSTGKVFGFVSVGLDLGGVVTPLLFGWIMDTGETRWLFWLTALILIVALAPVIGMRQRAGVSE